MDTACPDCARWLEDVARDWDGYVALQASHRGISSKQAEVDLLTAYHQTHRKEWLA